MHAPPDQEYSSKQIREMVQAHQKWLNHDPAGKQADFSNQEIRGYDFSKADLRYANFTNAEITECSFEKANLSGANLWNATIQDSQFTGANMDYTVAQKAQFIECGFEFAEIQNANFKETLLMRDNFRCANFSETDFMAASIVGGNMDLVYCQGAKNAETISPSLRGAATEEILNFREQIFRQFEKPNESVLRERMAWAGEWMSNVESGVWDRTKAYQAAEPYLKSIIHTDMDTLQKQKELQRNQPEEHPPKAPTGRQRQPSASKSLLSNAIKEQIGLLEYARQQGFTPVKVGHQWSLKEMDSIRINPCKDNPNYMVFYRHSSGERGSVIDFAMMIKGQSRDSAIKELRGLLPRHGQVHTYESTVKYPEVEVKKKLELPKAHNGAYKRVFAYLHQSRGIDSDIINELIKRRYLYEDTRHNAVFVGYDRDTKPAFATKRGTLTEASYKGDVTGSNKEVAFYVDNNADKIIISESAIDNMAIMTMLKDAGVDHHQFNYLALAGTSAASLLYHMKGQNVSELFICTDRDSAGLTSRNNIKALVLGHGFQGKISDGIPKHKDFDEDLTAHRLQQQPRMQTGKQLEHSSKKQNVQQINYSLERNR